MVSTVFKKCLLPETAAALLGLIGFIVDSFFIGNFLGVDGLAASGYMYPIVYAVFAIANLLAAGSKIATAKYLGLADKKGMNTVFSTVVISGCFISLVLTILLALNTGFIAQILTSEDHGVILDLSQAYLGPLIPGLLAMLMFYVLVSFAQFNNQQSKVLISALLIILVNFILDLMTVLVFKNGLFGIGVASSVSYFAGFAFLMVACFRKNRSLHFSFRLFRLDCLKQICVDGFLPFLNSLSTALFPFILNLLLTRYETTTAVAAYAIIKSVIALSEAPTDASSSIASSLASLYYAEKDKRQLAQVLRSAFLNSVTISIAVAAAVLLLANYIAAFFAGSDQITIEAAAAGMRVAIVALPVSAMVCSLRRFYEGLQLKNIVICIIIVNKLLLPTLAAVILLRCGAGDFVYACFLLAGLGTLVMLVVISSVVNKGFKWSLRSIAMIPRDLNKGMRILQIYDVHDLASADAAFKKAQDFCDDVCMEKTKAYAVALSVEEFSLFLMGEAFSSEDHRINICITEDSERVTVKFTDNTNLNDPKTFQELYEQAYESLDSLPALKYVNKESFSMDTYFVLRLNSYQFVF